ncbi:hypothetical protein [Bacillus cereus]|jgi:hypothetical protein|nr:hypothetical protein [Bacillus cereus]
MNRNTQKEMKPFEGKSMLKNLEQLKQVEKLREQEGHILHIPKYPNEIKR